MGSASKGCCSLETVWTKLGGSLIGSPPAAVEANDPATNEGVAGVASIILRSGVYSPRSRLTLNRCCSAIAGPDGLQQRSWYKGDLHELMCLGSGHASLLCVSWQARGVLIAMS